MLDVREMLVNHMFTYVGITHVYLELDPGVVEGNGLGHQVDNFTLFADLAERIHFHEVHDVTRVFRSDESVHRQRHSFDVHILAVIPHRPAHIH